MNTGTHMHAFLCACDGRSNGTHTYSGALRVFDCQL